MTIRKREFIKIFNDSFSPCQV